MNVLIKKLYNEALFETEGNGEAAMVESFAALLAHECHNAVSKYIAECGEVNSLPSSVINDLFNR